jgi:serine/threonine-protein kinase
MAAVYEAHDDRLDRTIALKVLPPEFLHDTSFSRRFEQEARVIARLEHPNIVPIYASGIDDGIPWMGMRLLTGGSLADILQQERLDHREAARILGHVARALDYAHARGIVHRDIKPSNILLDDSRGVCLGDFGLAQILGADLRVTRTGMLVGTPHYMAPEQALGEPADRRSDIYSLGIVAYEMLVGSLPFTADSPVGVLLKHVNQPLPHTPDLSRALLKAITKATAKEPGERWASAEAFASAVAAAGPGGFAETDAAEIIRPRTRFRQPYVRWTAAAACFFSASLAVAWWIAPEPEPSVMSVEPAARPSDPVEPTPAPIGVVPVDTPAGKATSQQPPLVDRQRPKPGDTKLPVKVEAAPPPLDVVLQEKPVAFPDRPLPATVPSAESPGPAAPVQSPEESRADLVTPPQRIRTVRPEYPAAARAAQFEGDVVLEAVVERDGTIGEVKVVRSVHPLLDEAARDAVRQYVYVPGQRQGTAEAATVRLTVSFRLK